jgi:hypothetical protein
VGGVAGLLDDGSTPQQPQSGDAGSSQSLALVIMIAGTMVALCTAWAVAYKTRR